MRSMKPLLRLCSRAQARDATSRSAATPFRRIHQDLRIRRIAPPSACQRRPQSHSIACSAHCHAFSTTSKRCDEAPSAPAAPGSAENTTAQTREDVPSYQMTFTCKACSTRSSHRISKQGYHKGTVLISCPGCKNRHLISDHLKIFSDKSITLQEILEQKGEKVKLGQVNGDLEFWDDGSQTPRSPLPERQSPAADAQEGEPVTPGASFKKGE